jgi:hypothetical protein
MAIAGMENMSDAEINEELEKGAKFIVYEFTFSILIMTFKRPSKVFFIKAGEGRVGKGMIYTFISLLFGWWGIPWGPIYTIMSMVTNFGGGKDMTQEILNQFQNQQSAVS